ncbi:hypothetical protein I656_00403 [Geobacillus sp. WSUCF1]|nr:hypothetical protein I656_00403 [Geobacillus sp. WSUCF1]
MYQHDIGKRSAKVKNVVERGAVKKFAEAIGDPNPIYWDEETGKRSRYGRNIAPPTFPRVFDYGVIEGLKLPSKGSSMANSTSIMSARCLSAKSCTAMRK